MWNKMKKNFFKFYFCSELFIGVGLSFLSAIYAYQIFHGDTYLHSTSEILFKKGLKTNSTFYPYFFFLTFANVNQIYYYV